MSALPDFQAGRLAELEDLLAEMVDVVERAGLTAEQQVVVLGHASKMKVLVAQLVAGRAA